ncbi:prolyl oligopeptidase family serine peptidase [Streptomyces sp. GC420]|nr:prolyl oligopeptidase family serine peptidase [Streptomyces sp. GC420]
MPPALAAAPVLAPAAAAAPAPASGTGVPYESPGVVGGNLPAFHAALRAGLGYPLAWGTSRHRSFPAWRRAARARTEELLRHPADDTPFRPEILDERPGDGAYVRRTLAFAVTRHSRVRAALLMPAGRGPHPGVLLLHDHGARFDIGKEKLIRPWYDETRLASAEAWAARHFGGRFPGDELAARGYAVLSVDALGWGDRSGLGYEGQQALAGNLLHLGSSLAGLIAREDMRAAEFLASLPGVDPDRVAALGFSMGAYRAWQVSALSDRVAAAVAVCWMTTLEAMMVPGNNTLRGQSAYCMLHPGLSQYLDIPDVASMAAPKPFLCFAGETDPLFPADGVAAAFERLAAVWRSQRAEDRLHTRTWPGLGHTFTPVMQDAAFAWLDVHMRP